MTRITRKRPATSSATTCRCSNGEFDVVTEDRKGYIFYEVKFRKEPLGQDIIRKEIQQVEETGMKCYRYGFISRAGFKNLEDTDIIAIDLKDLYKM